MNLSEAMGKRLWDVKDCLHTEGVYRIILEDKTELVMKPGSSYPGHEPYLSVSYVDPSAPKPKTSSLDFELGDLGE